MKNRDDYLIYGGILAIILGLLLMGVSHQDLKSYRWMSLKHRLKWKLYRLFNY